MAKAEFRLNYKAVGKFLKTDPGGKQAIREAAEQIRDKTGDPETWLDEYETDRFVVGVMVPADKQARRGTGTRAANQVAGGS